MSNNRYKQTVIVSVVDLLYFLDSTKEKTEDIGKKIINSLNSNEDLESFLNDWFKLYFDEYQKNKIGLLMVLSYIMIEREDFGIQRFVKDNVLESIYLIFNNSSEVNKIKIEELLDVWISKGIFEEKEISLQKLKFEYQLKNIPYKEYTFDKINSIDKSSKDKYIEEIPLFNKLKNDKVNHKEASEVELKIKSLLDSFKCHSSILSQVDDLLDIFKELKKKT